MFDPERKKGLTLKSVLAPFCIPGSFTSFLVVKTSNSFSLVVTPAAHTQVTGIVKTAIKSTQICDP